MPIWLEKRVKLALKSGNYLALEAAIQEAPAAGVDPGEVSSAQSRLQQMMSDVLS